jgi:hypothetical protein
MARSPSQPRCGRPLAIRCSEGRVPELRAYTSPYPTIRFHSVNVKSGQQTGSKRLESRWLNHAESDRKKAEKPHE